MHLTIFSQDRLHRVTFWIETTTSGWAVSDGQGKVSCDEDGFPYLCQEVCKLQPEPAGSHWLEDRDPVAELRQALRELWQLATTGVVRPEEVQMGLDRIAEWLHPHIPNPRPTVRSQAG